jgi:hypothetical protein
MLHPIVESLFLLKVARGYVAESIMSSDIEEKTELINYIQNEASDYEVMHLVTVGEMPEAKYDNVSEAVIWSIFKEAVILNAESLQEDILQEDIMTIVYEMGPVADFGYSSAQPILEFARATGTLDRDFLNDLTEGRNEGNEGVITPTPNVSNMDKIRKIAKKTTAATGAHIQKYGKTYSAAGGAAGVAALFGLYKMIKSLKAKRDAAKTPEAKAIANKEIAKVQKKIKSKKSKA